MSNENYRKPYLKEPKAYPNEDIEKIKAEKSREWDEGAREFCTIRV